MSAGSESIPGSDQVTQVSDATVAAPAGVAVDATASTVSAAPGVAAAITPAWSPEPGRELGPVRLLREIGRGATGVVFLGHHTVLGRDVAVKFLLQGGAAAEGSGIGRLVEEARAAAAVRHPHLTQIFHADVDRGVPYLVMEYVRGPTLRQLLESTGFLTVPVAAAVMADVAAAVAELHGNQVIHRDIKPTNVLLDVDGHVFVTDFGLAVRRTHASGAAAQGEFAGTPAYMAPEMFEGRVSPRTDVYAMGVTAFQLLTGATPFSGTFEELHEQHLRKPLPAENLREKGVADAVVEVLERSTHKQPMFRYKTAPDFARALRQAAGCEAPQVARARKELCDLIAGRRGEGQGPAGRHHTDDSGTGSSAYTETISRIATLKRERRRPTVADAIEPALVTIPLPSAPPTQPVTTATEVSPQPLTAPVLAVSILAIVYGTLLALWLVGEATGWMPVRVPMPSPSTGNWGVFLWLGAAAVTNLVLAGVLLVAASACLRLRSWGRRLMIRYAVADLVLQTLVLLATLAWVGPVTANQLAASAAAQDRSAAELSIYLPWAIRWLALCIFPALVLVTMTRRSVAGAAR